MTQCWECGESRPALNTVESFVPCPTCGAPAIGPFEPCVSYNEELRLTQMLLEDAPIAWHPWRGTSGMGHAVDLGYDMETGQLVGIQIWDDVRQRPLDDGLGKAVRNELGHDPNHKPRERRRAIARTVYD